MQENIFQTRRSVNFFDKDKKLDDDLLKQIINTAVLAPSAFNLQPWRLIAVKSDQAKQRLHSVAMKQAKIMEAPVVLIVVTDYEGYGKSNPMWAHMSKEISEKRLQGAQNAAAKLYGLADKKRIMYAQSNAGLFAMSIMYAAKYLGVDSHPMSGIDFDGVKQEFNLKDSEDAVMLICLGYFDQSQTLRPKAKRLGYDEIVETL